MKPHFHIVVLAVFLKGCISDRPPIEVDIPIQQSASSVIITNEGNFQYGNASICLYDPVTKNVSENYFEAINGSKLGDVCQSLTFANGNGYIVINNSGKIVVVDEASFEWNADILGFTSPRYFLQVSPSKAYVSELYSKKLKIVDISNNEISGQIHLGGDSESMQLLYGHVFIASPANGKLYKIDAQTDLLVDSLTLHINAGSLQIDGNDKIWVMCGGNENVGGKLYKVNPESMNIELELKFGKTDLRPSNLTLNSSLDTLYFIHESVYKLGISESAIPSNPFIESEDQIFYSIGFNPQEKQLYVADAIDYVQKGRIHIYSLNGHEVSSFTAGIIPGQIYFP